MANVPLLHLFDDMVRKSEVLSSGIEKEFIAFATYQENCRQQWCLDQDEIAKLRKENAKLKADTEALNAKLTHARNEQLSERNKRQKAENAQQHLESQVALIKELLNDEDARNRLKEKEVKLLTQISHCQQVIVNSPVKRAHEPDVSQLSASFSDDDYTEDDLTNTVNKFGEVEEHTPPKRLRKSYSSHDFVSKTVLKPESCKACGKLIRFAKLALKCRDCRVICTPNSTKKPVEENIEFYAPTVSPRIPALVLRCVEEIERRGLNQLGLYRVPGSEARVRELMAEFLKGKGSPDLTKETDENVICGTLKSFLKQLSEPILTYALHKRFLEAVEKPDEDDALLFQAVSELPAANRDTLAYLMVHLQKIAQSRECKMPVTNIAKVFAPTLVGYSCPHPEPVQMLTEAKIQPKIVEKLLEMPVDYWKQFLSVNEENIRSPPFNPNTHNADGTPKTPQGLTAPGASMLGPARSGDTPGGKSVKKKGSLLGRTPLTPRFGSKSKRPNKRPHHFFDSPMLK
ncbi:rac GTPase-activating protein 1-like isoform X4 [Xenia sp. Carnegie-2017]|uniref:rac GTPase-activating protein 1-like isoform X4 n=1 Tax=Xenia sp. Carnegie-2017 TaxID=2897299 RepID=UPI001F0365A7|nr:rac GTPase-activating protein 1-like isoform X4 [Xenia sp. Carnegie-2017]